MLDIDDVLNGLILFEDTAWKADAACKSMDTNLFFPEVGSWVPKEVKAVCESCPVQQQCLDYAIKVNIIVGYWGGKSVKQRRNIRRALLKGDKGED